MTTLVTRLCILQQEISCRVYRYQFKISTAFSYSRLAVKKELLFEAILSHASKSRCVCLMAQNSPGTECSLTFKEPLLQHKNM